MAARRLSQVRGGGGGHLGRPRSSSDARGAGWLSPVGRLLEFVLYLFTGSRTVERLLRTQLVADASADGGPSLAQAVCEARVRAALLADVEAGSHDGKRLARTLCAGTDPKDIAIAVIEAEGIKPERAGFHVLLQRLIATCEGVAASNAALAAASALYSAPFEAEDAAHVALLLDLWRELRPGVAPPGGGATDASSYRSEAWSTLGFQGVDPGTDFRGMGLLGLAQLLHLARTGGDTARGALAKLDLPRVGYPLAIVSIAISDWCVSLLRERRLDGHMSPCTLWTGVVGGKGGAPSEGTPLLSAADGDSDRIHDKPRGGGAPSFPPPSSPFDSGDLSAAALPTLHVIHACLMVTFDAIWWDDGDVATWVPAPGTPAAAALLHSGGEWALISGLDATAMVSGGGGGGRGTLRVGSSASVGAGGLGVHGRESGKRGALHAQRRGVVFALSRAARSGVGGTLSRASPPPTGASVRSPIPLTVMDFPRIFKAYKAAVEALLVAEG